MKNNRARWLAIGLPLLLTLSLASVAGAAPAKRSTIQVNDGAPTIINGLEVLDTDCTGTHLDIHNGFQVGPACVKTSDGEVSDADHNPSLLIVDAPDRIKQGQDFKLRVSTRNLVRDRFLGAAAGGFLVEASLLQKDGLQRGHFHTACRVLPRDDVAPIANVVPEFFLATEDGGGSARPDTVTIKVPGKDPITKKRLFNNGDDVQCASWAGDGSHRIPMMQKANETPAFDVVRIRVGK